jgi:ABC-2 type transport system ATP-binding protein
MRDEEAVKVQGLRKLFADGTEAVAGISFEVEPGEVFSLLGPNGAGKSTTIGMLTATVAPSSGTATLGGFDVSSEPLSARAISSVLFQDPVVDRPLSGRRNLEIHARLWGISTDVAQPRLDGIIEAFDLGGFIDRPVGTYSGGERRRLEIARTLVSDPKVVFLDEPTVGLDPRIRQELLEVIGALRERNGMSILITTHYLDEAARLSDRIAIMRAGEIVAMGSPRELISTLGEEIVEARFERGAEEARRELIARGIASSSSFAIGSLLAVPAKGDPARIVDEVNALARPTLSVVRRRATLDDVYLSLTQQAA